MSDIDTITHSAEDILNMPPQPKEVQVEQEEDYRRGFVHGVAECVWLINKIYDFGYIRPREIANIIKNWLYTELYHWRYNADNDFETNPNFGTETPSIKLQRWQYIRQKIFQRDGYECRACGSKEFLEVDHIESVKNGGLPEETNLQVLCKMCNRKKGIK